MADLWSFPIKYEDDYGNEDCEVDASSDGMAMLTWVGSGGVEIRQMEISLDELRDILSKQDNCTAEQQGCKNYLMEHI